MTLYSKTTSIVLKSEILSNGSCSVAKEWMRLRQAWILSNYIMEEVVKSSLQDMLRQAQPITKDCFLLTLRTLGGRTSAGRG
jgi:hypothetical protein